MKHFVRIIVATISLCLCASAFSAAPSLEDLIKPIKFKQIKISPDGKKIAVISLEDGKRVLAMMTLEPLAITYVLRFLHDQEVGEFYWVNNERLITTVWERNGWMDKPIESSYLYALNYDGKKRKTAFGYSVGYDGQTSSRIKKQKAHTAHAAIISTLSGDDKNILISTYPWKVQGRYWRYTGDTYGEVLKLNVYNGRTKKVMSVPSRGGRAFADDKGNVRFAEGQNTDGINEFYLRKDGEWLRLGDVERDQLAYPVGFSEDGRTAYLESRLEGDKWRLVSMDLATGVETEIYSHTRVDTTDIGNYPGTGEPMVVYLDDGMPSAHFLDPAHKVSRYMRGIHQAFAGYRVTIESETPDGKLIIVSVEGDNMPADFFLVNLETKKAEMLMSAASWLEPSELAKTEAFDMVSRDGLSLQGYVTFPKSGRENLPTIVLPHDGPRWRDIWKYNRDAQIFANAGYLVMSVNFRGSSGYGHRFASRSDGQWGSLVQNDIADATRWIVEKGYTDAKRICIFGASFGAYSAMMNVILEPNLYQCAAGFAGVYDLEMMYDRGDIQRNRAGIAYLEDVLGTDEKTLQNFSPVHNVDKIKVPIFIAHGGEDERAPIEHAQALEAALKLAKVDVETQYYEKGGHGYYTPEANMALYEALLAFFDKNIGE